ncbi:LSU ribosomal protein L6P [Stackebrandtia endophytica]|uniref:Large ribosomal subunit protein uL6 n=1 Tax=Stackebrandtia endophytica TaxID=1496996 RepID=A0A543AZS1_9ACTN|nr:50S ribosomal protein L6 [Stackebrandtia endophytica]TQL78085.1 LSU ribosomal protein L6P [Stackebrandtia endophytica]
MSRIGRKSIPVPGNVEVTITGTDVKVKGPKGELSRTLVDPITITKNDDGSLQVNRPDDERRSRAMHGLCRSLVANMVLGVTEGYKKSLEINGTGYRVQLKGSNLEFALGFSHPVVVTPPEGIKFTVEKPTLFHVEGIDKQAVGEVAANIRKIRPPEPYKGKGVKYVGEHIRRKAGKAGK